MNPFSIISSRHGYVTASSLILLSLVARFATAARASGTIFQRSMRLQIPASSKRKLKVVERVVTAMLTFGAASVRKLLKLKRRTTPGRNVAITSTTISLAVVYPRETSASGYMRRTTELSPRLPRWMSLNPHRGHPHVTRYLLRAVFLQKTVVKIAEVERRICICGHVVIVPLKTVSATTRCAASATNVRARTVLGTQFHLQATVSLLCSACQCYTIINGCSLFCSYDANDIPPSCGIFGYLQVARVKGSFSLGKHLYL